MEKAVETAASLLAGLWLCAALAGDPAPRVDAPEPEWSVWIAAQIGAEAEVAARDKAGPMRADIVTTRHAIEADWPYTDKVVECPAQAVRYAKALNRRPVCLFLIGRGDTSDEKARVAAAAQVAKQYGPTVQVFTFDVRYPHKALEALRLKLDIPKPDRSVLK